MKKKLFLVLFLILFIPYIYAEEIIEEIAPEEVEGVVEEEEETKEEEIVLEEPNEVIEATTEEENEVVEYSKNCEVSEAYLEYMAMSKEERRNLDVPEYCASDGIDSYEEESDNRSSVTYATTYPSRYVSESTAVRNQDKTGACWAYASTSVVEGYLLKKWQINNTYSPGHLNYFESQSFYDRTSNPYGVKRSVRAGGNFMMSGLYYSGRYGPVFEYDFKTVADVENLPNINSSTVLGQKYVLNVNNIEYTYRSKAGACSLKEKNRIKGLVKNYGAAGVSIFMDYSYLGSGSSYIYKSGKLKTNHSVMIIGWDDNYSRNNFDRSYRPNSNGAWIVQNSYGTYFGDNGIMYISYEDTNICARIFAIRSADGNMDDNKYVHVHDLMDDSNNAPANMNVFQKKKNGVDEYLSRVTFYVAKPGKYKVYYSAGNASKKRLEKMKLIASGTAKYTGWLTVTPNKTVKISKNTSSYSIAVYQSSKVQFMSARKQYIYDENDNRRLVYSNDGFTKGKSYLYWYGRWHDLYNAFSDDHYKSPINAFTDNANLKITSATPKYYNDRYFDININVKALYSGNIYGVDLVRKGKIYASDYKVNKDVTKGNNYTITLEVNDISYITNGTYKVRVIESNGMIYYKNVVIRLIPIKGIIITNKKGLKLGVGETMQLNAYASPANFNITSKTLTYTSSNTNIATVDANGVITGKNPGNVTISVSSSNGVVSTYDLVVHKPIKDLILNKTVYKMEVGNQETISFSITPSDTTDDKLVTWRSSDNDKAVAVHHVYSDHYYVDIWALEGGVISVEGETSNGIKKTVDVLIKGFSIDQNEVSLELKNSTILTANIVDDNYNVSHNVTWSSSNPSVVSVDQNGKVFGKKLGSATISAKDSTGRVATSKVTVTKVKASSFTIGGIGNKTYTGKSIKPNVKVSYNGKTLKNGKNYTVKYGTNKYPGKGVVKITAKKSNTYGGSKKVTFVIKPKKENITKISSSSSSIKVIFNAQPKVKYQIQYKVKEDSVWQTINVGSNSKTIKNLYKGFNYQVRVRAYVTVDGNNYFGPWSKVKVIKCK